MARADYEQYKKLLLKLHEMHAHGTDQTDEADVIRDQMDGPGYRLTEAEFDRIKGLAGDLYMLTGDEVKELGNEPFDLQGFELAAESQQWETSLNIMRKSNFPESAPEWQTANMRAICWSQLGDFDASLLFGEFAMKLNPDEKNIRAMVLYDRLQLGLEVNPVELANIADWLGCTDTKPEKQKEVIIHYHKHTFQNCAGTLQKSA